MGERLKQWTMPRDPLVIPLFVSLLTWIGFFFLHHHLPLVEEVAALRQQLDGLSTIVSSLEIPPPEVDYKLQVLQDQFNHLRATVGGWHGPTRQELR